MHQTHEARAASRGGPFQHLLVAVGIAECEDRPPPDKTINPHRFPRTVVDKLDLVLFEKHRLAPRPELIAYNTRRTDHLLGRNAVNTLGEHPHELYAAAGHDKGLKSVGAQIT